MGYSIARPSQRLSGRKVGFWENDPPNGTRMVKSPTTPFTAVIGEARELEVQVLSPGPKENQESLIESPPRRGWLDSWQGSNAEGRFSFG